MSQSKPEQSEGQAVPQSELSEEELEHVSGGHHLGRGIDIAAVDGEIASPSVAVGFETLTTQVRGATK